MDEEMKRSLQELTRLAILNYAEIQYLKKRLYEHLNLSPDHFHDYADNLADFIRDLDRKNRNLIKRYSHLGD